jgi:hypothetical protein
LKKRGELKLICDESRLDTWIKFDSEAKGEKFSSSLDAIWGVNSEEEKENYFPRSFHTYPRAF